MLTFLYQYDKEQKIVKKSVFFKTIAFVLLFAMALTMFTSCGSSGTDPWDYSKARPATQLVLVNADKKLFSGMEWNGKPFSRDADGNMANQSDIVRINTLDYHTVGTVVFDSVENALEGAISYDRTLSPYYKLITGEDETWKLAVYQNEDDARNAGVLNDFYKVDYDMSAAPKYEGEDKIYSFHNAYYGGFKDVTLPCSWQVQGFDFPIYTNYTYPWSDGAYGIEKLFTPRAPEAMNPVGFYRYEFDVSSDWMSENRRVYISFGGVESAYYVYVNGHEVGYAEDSFDAHDFDITPYLNKDGKDNLLAVKVYRWCDGSYFEDQDFLRLAGIFRDVYLYSTTGVRMSDYFVVTDLDDDYKDATLKLDVEVTNTTAEKASGLKLDVKLFDADKNNVFALSALRKNVPSTESGQTVTVSMEKKVSSPHLWSDEDPYLYTLVITMYDSNGVYYGSISQQLGFREITFTPTEGTSENEWYDTVLLNGQPLMMKGVNRHDTDGHTGRYISHELAEKDVILMKQLNINAVRTSHYPNDEYFYNMCDKYGVLVIGECNVETHYNVSGGDTEEYFSEVVRDRIRAHTQAYKNRTSIIMWSMGNETIGGTTSFIESIQEIKEWDGTRPIHFESQGSGGGVDIASTMYANIQEMNNRGGWENHMPYMQCEYSHAMGNSVGNLYEYWEPIRQYDNLIGAFIWDYIDQGIWTEVPDGKYDYYGTGEYLAYGGTWGDNPNSGDFCQNGILSNDRTPQPEAQEVKYVYQSVWFTNDKPLTKDNREVSIFNEFRFTDLNAYDFSYELLCNGEVVDSGSFDVACKPLETVNVTIPYTIPERSGENEYLLSLYATLKEDTSWGGKAGDKIAIEQLDVRHDSEEESFDLSSLTTLSAEESGSTLVIKGEEFELTFDKSKGNITTYVVNGETILEKGPTPLFTRARHNNDNMWGVLDNATVSKAEEFSYTVASDSKSVDVHTRLKLSAGNSYVIMDYTVYGGGQIKVSCELELSSEVSELLVYGNMMSLSADYDEMTYYGRGDADTYNDRKRGSLAGIYTQSVEDSFFPYLKPQDTGNKTGLRYLALSSDEKDTGLLIACDGLLEGAALHYSHNEISNAKYTYGLPKEIKNTYLNINYGSRGTGGASCGPETLPEYKILNDGRDFSYTYTIIPYTDGDDIGELANLWRVGE